MELLAIDFKVIHNISVLLGSFANIVADVLLHEPNASPCTFFDSKSILSFLSFVEIAKVPLHVFVGPILDVYTRTEATETWLNEYLVNNACEYDGPDGEVVQDKACWWMQYSGQPDVGILLNVDGGTPIRDTGPRATEILLYAVLPKKSERCQNSPLTPPRSSSPSYFNLPFDSSSQSLPSAKVCARLIYTNPSMIPGQYHGDSKLDSHEEVNDTARFLTPPLEDCQSSFPLQKRQRLDTIFDNAAQKNKQSRKLGGDSLAKAVADSDMSSWRLKESKSIERQIHEKERETPDSSAVKCQVRPTRTLSLSRSQSLGSMKDLDTMRPSGRLGSGVPNKRSSLYRVASVATYDSSSPVPESINGVEQQNKTALTRVVMAALRLYGFQPKKKASQPNPKLEDISRPGTASGINQPSPDEEEYKMLYHQTFKSASFVFRNHLACQMISQDSMREAVDRLLAMFCIDPLQTVQLDDAKHQPFGSELPKTLQLFDSPSDGKALDQAKECYGTPRKVPRP